MIFSITQILRVVKDTAIKTVRRILPKRDKK